MEGLGARVGGPWWSRREKGRPAANWTGSGDVPEGKGGGGRVQKVQGGEVELAEGSVGREEERKDGLRGSLGAAALMAALDTVGSSAGRLEQRVK